MFKVSQYLNKYTRRYDLDKCAVCGILHFLRNVPEN